MMAAAPVANHAASMTPPSSSHEPSDIWELSVPVDAPYNYRRKPSIGSDHRAYSDLHAQKQRRTDGSGGRSRQGSTSTHTQTRSHSRATARRTDSHDDTAASVRQNSDQSNRHLANMYNGPESYNDENNPPSWADSAEYDYESSRWIHRDKLAEIESQELRSAGIYVLPSERLEIDSGSLKRKRLSANLDQNNNTDSYQQDSYESDPTFFDPRTPEEIAAEQMRLKNGSKIPLATTSPMPIPQEYIERNVPLTRPQPSPESTPQQHTRKRSHSTGSNYLLDTTPIKSPAAVAAATPKTANSTPTSQANKKTPSTRGRQQQQTSMAKKRTRSNPQLHNARPKTSSSAMPTSPTHKEHFVPEGPPPWANSYKPDPSLPPDQQIIPTVAKRLAQEKWEKEGKFASDYDRSLRPVRVISDEELKARNRQSQEPNQPTAETTKPQEKRASYSVVPPPEPKPTPPINGIVPQPKPETPRVQEPVRMQDPESLQGKERKGPCCCIIM